MSRDLVAGNAAKAAAANVYPVVFMHLAFTSVNGNLYLHDSLGVITWGGQDWLGVGDLGGIATIEESDDISPFALRATLSGITPDVVDEAVNQDYFGDRVNVYLGFLNATTLELDDDPQLYWSGYLDNMSVILGVTNAIELTAENELARFSKTNGRMYTDASQQSRYPGDTFFALLPQITELKLKWGGDSVDVSNGGTPITPPEGPGRPGDPINPPF